MTQPDTPPRPPLPEGVKWGIQPRGIKIEQLPENVKAVDGVPVKAFGHDDQWGLVLTIESLIDNEVVGQFEDRPHATTRSLYARWRP